MEIWKTVLEKFQRVATDDLTIEETQKLSQTYLAIRDQLDLEPLSDEGLPFQDYFKRVRPAMPSPEQMQQMQQMTRKHQEQQEEQQKKQRDLKKSIQRKVVPKSSKKAAAESE